MIPGICLPLVYVRFRVPQDIEYEDYEFSVCDAVWFLTYQHSERNSCFHFRVGKLSHNNQAKAGKSSDNAGQVKGYALIKQLRPHFQASSFYLAWDKTAPRTWRTIDKDSRSAGQKTHKNIVFPRLYQYTACSPWRLDLPLNWNPRGASRRGSDECRLRASPHTRWNSWGSRHRT